MNIEEMLAEAFDRAEDVIRSEVKMTQVSSDGPSFLQSLDIFYEAFKRALVPLFERYECEYERENEQRGEQEDSQAYLRGLQDGRQLAKYCARCRKKIALSVHHILPRAYGGTDVPDNLMLLCFECHNAVEHLTDELLKNGHHYTPLDIEEFILEDCWPSRTPL